MGGSVDGPEALGRDLGVDLGGGDRGVAEHLLHYAYVGAAVEHVGGAGVAQHVGSEQRPDPGRLAVAAHDEPQSLAAQAPAAAG